MDEENWKQRLEKGNQTENTDKRRIEINIQQVGIIASTWRF